LLSNTVIAEQIIDNSFITKKEYGAMLYKNPRGIGCNKCHGTVGQGKLIAKYKQIDKKTNKLIEKSLIAPAINEVDFETFKEILMKKKNKSLSMPTYFLTEDELTSIHFYITNVEK
jgi:pyruvate/2-oxoglutarate dehydrogenase complex dihydrolipoamide acyltransferase (E2) component